MARKSNLVTGIDNIESLVQVFKGNTLFADGLTAGVESETWEDRHLDPWLRNSPIRLLASMPAWEGSGRAKGKEHDLAYSIGAVVGAFATRAGIDVSALYDQVNGTTT